MAWDRLAAPLPEVRGWLGRESTRRFLLLGLEIVFLLVLVVSVETLFSRANLRFDLTPQKKYSLFPLTVQILHPLTHQVQATVFYRRRDRHKHEDLLSLLAQERPLFSSRS